MKNFRKVAYNFKMTLVCGFITFLVFRGTFGAGKFGTPFQDAEILNRELRSFQEKGLLKSRESQLLFLQDKMTDRNSPYRAGPNITDWDEQRAEHIALNPGCNSTSDGRPRVMIVSTSQPKPCEHSVGDHFQLLFLKSKLDYARWASAPGSFLLRNNQWSLDLLAKWAAMGARGRAREEAGRVLTAQLKVSF
ncbi:unnamed protein product [Closterium sp. Naga37s-1]|nr:unnamed protein product [Closterium sp. Naga37s-1]